MSTLRLSELARVVGVLAGVTLLSSTALADPPAPSASIPEDELSAYRERFNLGMDRYSAGAISEAIGYWEPIYRQLGPKAGYRLAYNLGVGYGHLGDATRAAERLQAFLDEVDGRRGQGQALGAVVAKEEADAHQRMADLTASKGRIRIPPADPPVSVQVDANEPRVAGFVAWVEPGEHTVTFEPQASKSETRVVQAKAGEIVEVVPPAPPEAPPAPEPTPPKSSMPAPPMALEAIAPKSPHEEAYERKRPFSPVLLAASIGLDVAVGIAAVVLESRAISLHDQLENAESSTGTISANDRGRFDEERTWAYTAVGGAVGLGAVTAGLVSWYFVGSSKQAGVIKPAFAPERGGAIAGAMAHF
jgi:hypothetical protein